MYFDSLLPVIMITPPFLHLVLREEKEMEGEIVTDEKGRDQW